MDRRLGVGLSVLQKAGGIMLAQEISRFLIATSWLFTIGRETQEGKMKCGNVTSRGVKRRLLVSALAMMIPCLLTRDVCGRQILLIDNIYSKGKVHLAKVGEKVSVYDLFGPTKVNWLITNRHGQSVCSLRLGQNTLVLKLDALSNHTGPVVVASSKIPAPLQGDLSPDGAKMCFRIL